MLLHLGPVLASPAGGKPLRPNGGFWACREEAMSAASRRQTAPVGVRELLRGIESGLKRRVGARRLTDEGYSLNQAGAQRSLYPKLAPCEGGNLYSSAHNGSPTSD